jgi:hypothetical protein
MHPVCPQRSARKSQSWCRNHSDPGQRQRNADAREIVTMILKMDSFNVTLALCNTLNKLRSKLIPPLHAQTVFEAARRKAGTFAGGTGADPSSIPYRVLFSHPR